MTSVRGGVLPFTGNWTPVPGLVREFHAAGGPVQINLSLPLVEGSHSACRALIDGIPAGHYSGADVSYQWQEGITYVLDWWRMWNNQRLYVGLTPGKHVVTVECLTDLAGSTAMGRNDTAALLTVIPYGPAETSEVKAYAAAALGGQVIGKGNFVRFNGLSLPFHSQGGPVRIGISIPIESGTGNHASCRPLIDGLPAGGAEGEIDDTGYVWQEGVVYASAGWNMFNRNRIYPNIPKGSHTLSIECVTDTSNSSFNSSRMSAQLYAIAYPPDDGSARVRATRSVSRGVVNMVASSGWVTFPDLQTTFEVKEGSIVETGVSLPLYGGSHTACRTLIDGQPAVPGEVDNSSDAWPEGLVYTGHGWAQWDRSRVYRGLTPGTHTATVQCRNDNAANGQAGHSRMLSTLWAVSYDP